MRRKPLSSAFALAGIVSTLFFGTTVSAHSAQPESARNSVRQPFLNRSARGLIAYAPPAAPSAGDYLDAVSVNGSHRWSAERMPLKVFIEEGSRVPGYRGSFKALLTKSFDEWCRISGGKLSWQEVSSSRDADIVCNYSDTPRKSGPAGFEAGVTNTIIQQNRYTGQSSIQSALMTILTQWRGRVFTDSEIYMTSLHEVGHAMGMQGHSNVKSDIMYSTVNRQQTPVLTQRDANTVSRLYKSYGTEPTVAYSSGRRNPGNYPQFAPRANGSLFGGGGERNPYAAGRNAYGDSQRNPGSEQNPYRPGTGGSGSAGAGRSNGRVLEGDVQPFAPVDMSGVGGSGGDPKDSGDRFSYGSGADQYGANDGSGNGFRGPSSGGGWRRGGGHRRARWRNLDPNQRAAMMARRQQMMEQMQQQGFMPGDGNSGDGMQPNGMQSGFIPGPGFMPAPGSMPGFGGMMQDNF